MTAENIKGIMNAIIEGLTPLAHKLGIATEMLFGWAVKHNYAIAISEALAWLFVAFLAIPLYKLYKWGLKKNENSSYTNFDNSEGITVGTAVTTIFYGILLLVLSIFLFTESVPRLIAPEYYSAQDIIHLINPPKNN